MQPVTRGGVALPGACANGCSPPGKEPGARSQERELQQVGGVPTQCTTTGTHFPHRAPRTVSHCCTVRSAVRQPAVPPGKTMSPKL